LTVRGVRHVVTQALSQGVSEPPNHRLNLPRAVNVCCQFIV